MTLGDTKTNLMKFPYNTKAFPNQKAISLLHFPPFYMNSCQSANWSKYLAAVHMPAWRRKIERDIKRTCFRFTSLQFPFYSFIGKIRDKIGGKERREVSSQIIIPLFTRQITLPFNIVLSLVWLYILTVSN